MMTLNVVCIMDLLELDSVGERKQALEAVKSACQLVEANFDHMQLHHGNSDIDETSVLDQLYNADVAVVDLSVVCQQRSLFYHVGVRESFDMLHTIILYNDTSAEATKSLRSLCSSYDFVPYRSTDEAVGGVTQSKAYVTGGGAPGVDEDCPLFLKLQQLLRDVVLHNKAHMKEKFLADLRKAREVYSGADLKAQLTVLRKRLDDPKILGGDVVLAMLFAFRDVEDHEAMVQLVDSMLPAAQLCTSSLAVLYLFCFALNRRNRGNDRERARNLIKEALNQKDSQLQDLACLYGRMHKDQFVESGHKDQESLNNAIFWYRKGFEDHPNEYAGINLATLLVIAGNDLTQSSELHHIALFLYNLIGKKGSLDKLEDYWDVATFFEISVLAEDYGKAVQAAEYMFKLKPPNWHLKSTMGNIALILGTRTSLAQKAQSAAHRQFEFWASFFNAASSTDDFVEIPVLVMKQTQLSDASIYRSGYASLRLEAGDKVLQLQKLNIGNSCEDYSEMQVLACGASSIKSVTQHKLDPRSVSVEVAGHIWQVVLPSQQLSVRFCELLHRVPLSCMQRSE